MCQCRLKGWGCSHAVTTHPPLPPSSPKAVSSYFFHNKNGKAICREKHPLSYTHTHTHTYQGLLSLHFPTRNQILTNDETVFRRHVTRASQWESHAVNEAKLAWRQTPACLCAAPHQLVSSPSPPFASCAIKGEGEMFNIKGLSLFAYLSLWDWNCMIVLTANYPCAYLNTHKIVFAFSLHSLLRRM